MLSKIHDTLHAFTEEKNPHQFQQYFSLCIYQIIKSFIITHISIHNIFPRKLVNLTI